MNYVSHLNTIFRRFSADPKLNPTHISLYMALFQFWNLSHFAAVIYINREEVMKMSKIGSLATYHRCLKQLHQGNYIVYLPSHNPFKSSQIKFLKFETTCGTSSKTSSERSTETTSDKRNVQVQERALVPKKNNRKHYQTSIDIPDSKEEVLVFFKTKIWPEAEAVKFFNHYSAVGWKFGGKAEIKNWRAAAENWVLRAEEKKIDMFSNNKKSKSDYLKISNSKDYGKPL